MSAPIHRREFLGQTATTASGLALVGSARAEEDTISNESSANLKVGFVTHAGGAHLDAYFTALAAAEEVGSVVLADADGKSETMARNILGEKLRQVYKDCNRLFAQEKPAMALISMEAKESPAAIRAALEAGCHVFAEKPACTRAEDFQLLVEMANSKDLYLMLALANRLNPEIVEAKRLIATGLLGKIYGLEMHLIADQTRLTKPSYQQTWQAHRDRAGGGHLAWLGIHWLDLAMYLTNSRIKQVAGFAGNVGGQPIDVEDSAAMSMRFDNGTYGTLTSGYYLDRGYHSLIKIWGAAGWLQISREMPNSVEWYSNKTSKTETFTGPSDHNAYSTFVRAAVRASAGLQSPPLTGDESLYVLKTIFGLYRAAESGKTQQIE
ncbi:MAG: Gfo/Idh/MocA family oxidoreductase [Planctomycetales bacterium]|nr:Gfo/Idh/MocA family oxidoreductase [Planctomycetales bacterium]